MNQTHKISFISILILIFFLPLFFLPVSVLPLGGTKVLLLSVGVITALVALLVDVMRAGKLVLPRSRLLWGVFLLPLVYFLSGFLSADRVRSIFGYEFEVGTFGYILLVSVLFGIVAYVFDERGKILRALGAFFLSSGVLLLFALVKLFSHALGGQAGGFPVWGIFGGNMDNPVGVWTDYSMMFGLLLVFVMLVLAMVPVKKLMRTILAVVLVLGLVVTAIINFSTTWVLLLVSAVVILVYLLTTEKRILNEGGDTIRKPVIWPAILVGVVSLLFIINPVFSSTSGGLGNTISSTFGVSNVDVRPSLSATLDISKQVLDKNLILGSGPNTFDRNWLLYKPQAVNNSAFWNVSFPFGFGFLPTQIATTGVVGSVVWLAFLILFLILGVKTLARLPREDWNRFTLLSTLFLSLFLWTASFMYVPSRVMFALAFLFTGLFVASARVNRIIGTREIGFAERPITNFAAVLLVIALGVGSAGVALLVLQKTVSAFHFQRALVLSNMEGSSADLVQEKILKAVGIVPKDTYYRAISQLNVARAQALLNATTAEAGQATGTQEENQQKFQTAVSDSIAAAQLAADVAPLNYENWIGLGSIYASLVPKPFSVEGAYESALSAYARARDLNPTSPEIPLLLARLELDNGDSEMARKHIQSSLVLKQDYADAYLLLTQLELSENNLTQAILSAETTAFLSPNNAGIFLQLGLLKYSNSDWTGARDAFLRALVILPDYANAKYYLGLTLNKLDQNERAIELFTDLVKTNPDNDEVKLILENLEYGRDPLLNLPTTQEIENREELPL